jgi:type II secretory pathway pseudopilin PulG
MCIVAAAAVVGTAASIGGSIMGFQAQNKAAWEQRAYNMKVEAQQERYRAELIEYQNVVYQGEVDHGHKLLDYSEGEFSRQAKFRDNAAESIQKNLFAQYATIFQRAIEENIASAFDVRAVAKEGQAVRAKARAAADSKGVEGASVEAIIDDVSRQEGENRVLLEMNRSATQRQLHLEAMGLKASADQQLYNIPLQTFQPSAPLNPPNPISPVTPAAPVASPSRGAMVANVIGAGVQGLSNYASWSGQTMKQAFSF